MKIGTITSVKFFGNEKFAVGKILEGGMGTVYQLIPIRMGMPVFALKTLKGNMKIRDFDRECEAWLSVSQHKNVARAFAFGNWEGMPSILVDWYGKSLAELKAEECSNHFIIEIITGLFSALNFTYKTTGMIHQDIKPANVLIDDQGCIKLGDFGLARCGVNDIEVKESENLDYANLSRTSSGVLGGTPFYMAPELFTGEKPSIKTDIFSMGVTIYHFLTGEHPYFGSETNGKLSKQIRMEPLRRFLDKNDKDLLKAINVIIACLSIDPKGRPNNYQETGMVVEAKLEKENQDKETDSKVRAVVAKAMLYIDKGDIQIADNLLLENLSKSAENPILLNFLGSLRLKQGRNSESLSAFKSAFEVLKKKKGLFRSDLFLEPAINLAGLLLESKNFNDANKILKSTWSWAKEHSNDEDDLSFLFYDKYCFGEFGWMFLNDGDFGRASVYLENVISKKETGHIFTYYLLEAAWLSDQMKEYADLVGRRIISRKDPFNPLQPDLASAFANRITSEFVNPQLRQQLWGSQRAGLRDYIKLEDESGLKNGSLVIPKTFEAQKILILSLDNILTGGKHNGFIRQISQPRLGQS